MPAMAEVNIGCDGSRVTVSGRVARDLVGTPLYLSCYLIEDGISTAAYPQLGMNDPDAPADLQDVFRHNGVILHHFTAEAIGDLLTTEAGGTYSLDYPMTEKAGFGGTVRRLVAFIHKVNRDNPYDNYVLNAAEMRLGGDDGISLPEGNKEQGIPRIYDLQGRRITNSRLHPGLYIRGNRKVMVR